MPMKSLFYMPALFFVCLVIALATGLALRPGAIPSAVVGHPLPDFTAPELQEQRLLTTADFKDGRVKLLNVFASWCEPCRAENNLLMALQRQGFVIYALNYKDDKSEADFFLKTLGNPFERIGVDADGRLGIDLGVSGVPETFVVDGQGVVLYQHIGALTERDVVLFILPLLRRNS